jgi:hypothetical protein
MCVTEGGGDIGQTDKHLPQSPITSQFFKMTTFCFRVYIVNWPAPPPFGSGGGHTRLRERAWADPIRTRGQTLCYSRYSIIPLRPIAIIIFFVSSCKCGYHDINYFMEAMITNLKREGSTNVP